MTMLAALFILKLFLLDSELPFGYIFDPLGLSMTRERGKVPAPVPAPAPIPPDPDPFEFPPGEPTLSLARLLLSNAFAMTMFAKKSARVIAAVSATLEYVQDDESASSSLLAR